MTDIATASNSARLSNDPNILIQAIPYACLLGIEAISDNQFLLPAKRSNVGNPMLPAIHGGAVGGFLELAATLHLIMKMDVLKMPKVVDISIDYIRPARFRELYARCKIQRFGNKLVNISIESWQADQSVLIATARAPVFVGLNPLFVELPLC